MLDLTYEISSCQNDNLIEYFSAQGIKTLADFKWISVGPKHAILLNSHEYVTVGTVPNSVRLALNKSGSGKNRCNYNLLRQNPERDRTRELAYYDPRIFLAYLKNISQEKTVWAKDQLQEQGDFYATGFYSMTDDRNSYKLLLTHVLLPASPYRLGDSFILPARDGLDVFTPGPSDVTDFYEELFAKRTTKLGGHLLCIFESLHRSTIRKKCKDQTKEELAEGPPVVTFDDILAEPFYEYFDIPKKNGKIRRVYNIKDEDAKHQLSLYGRKNLVVWAEKVFKKIYKGDKQLSLPAAYRKKKSIGSVTKAIQKILDVNPSTPFLSLDIKDYFSSITWDDIKRCCKHLFHDLTPKMEAFLKYIMVDTEGRIYPGHPLAGIFTNIVIAKTWKDIQVQLSYSNIKGFIYADDMVFLSTVPNNPKLTKYHVHKIVTRQLEKNNLSIQLNEEKTKVMIGDSRTFLGVVYRTDGTITSSKKVRKKIRALLHQLSKDLFKDTKDHEYVRKFYKVLGLINYYGNMNDQEKSPVIQKFLQEPEFWRVAIGVRAYYEIYTSYHDRVVINPIDKNVLSYYKVDRKLVKVRGEKKDD